MEVISLRHFLVLFVTPLLPDLSKAKVFSVCDVKNGFWHVELDEDSSYLTTFGTPFGRYRWLKMPFGISPAPEYFQHRLDQAIEGLPGVRTVADDISPIQQKDVAYTQVFTIHRVVIAGGLIVKLHMGSELYIQVQSCIPYIHHHL